MSKKAATEEDTIKPCKAIVKRLKKVALFPDKDLQEYWKSIYLEMDTELHCLERDIKDSKEGRDDIKLTVECIGTHLNNAYYLSFRMMDLFEISFHGQYHTFQDSKSLGKLRSEWESMGKDWRKHKPLLEVLHDEYDKTAESEKHGREVYR